MKSRRYVYIFWHTIILAVINAWLLYKRECKAPNAKAGDPDQETVSGRSSILSHPGEHNSSENTQERTTIFRQREPSTDGDILEPVECSEETILR
ncbi:hypothetical protein F7725_020262 [Dissostichus mawsoni]|uniref:Uncharacterized protein n=1 Tax=Dissostichus mawsoni TaxID=36200 RepID=A0A7J5YCQ4_DISMA|nr:hypothetical protein F7725_020262 [Dissostichus mawsoni]